MRASKRSPLLVLAVVASLSGCGNSQRSEAHLDRERNAEATEPEVRQPAIEPAIEPEDQPAIEPEIDPSHVLRVLDLASRAEEAEGEEAVRIWTELIKLEPEESDHFYHRGKVHRAMRQLPLAIADMKRAIELDPEPGSYRHLAELYSESGEHEAALAEVNALVERVEDNRDAPEAGFELVVSHYTRANVLEAAGRLEDAIAEFETVIGLSDVLKDEATLHGQLIRGYRLYARTRRNSLIKKLEAASEGT